MNSSYVSVVDELGLSQCFFDFLTLDHPNNNVHNIRLCRQLALSGCISTQQLLQLRAADKVGGGALGSEQLKSSSDNDRGSGELRVPRHVGCPIDGGRNDILHDALVLPLICQSSSTAATSCVITCLSSCNRQAQIEQPWHQPLCLNMARQHVQTFKQRRCNGQL